VHIEQRCAIIKEVSHTKDISLLMERVAGIKFEADKSVTGLTEIELVIAESNIVANYQRSLFWEKIPKVRRGCRGGG